MTKRARVDVPQITFQEFSELCGNVARLQLDLDADVAAMKQRLDNLRREHEEYQQQLAAQIERDTQRAMQWAEHNQEHFAAARSLELTRCTVGFRLGQPTVTTKKGITQADAIENLLADPAGEQFVRMGKPTLDKESIIRERNTQEPLFTRSGILVTQTERFFIDPKAEKPAEV